MKNVSIQCNKDAMLSSASIPLFPINVSEFGGVLEALVYQQIGYLSESIFYDGVYIKAVRISYTRLQKHIPSTTRRTIIKVVAVLSHCGAIKVIKTKRVNLLTRNEEYKFKTLADEHNGARMLVFPELLEKLSLLEAIVLQQIHVRCVGKDGSVWMIRTYRQLQSQLFPFVSLATVTRLVTGLRRQELLYMKPYTGDDGVVNSYRVNYQKVAELLGVPVPEVMPPKPKSFGEWINPVYPLVHLPALD